MIEDAASFDDDEEDYGDYQVPRSTVEPLYCGHLGDPVKCPV